jgi:transcriptional regulator with XRE-family HTH domain
MRLSDWMSATGLEDDSLARMVGSDRSTISRIRRGLNRPSWELVAKLTKLSGGAVSANDFLASPKDEPAEARA